MRKKTAVWLILIAVLSLVCLTACGETEAEEITQTNEDGTVYTLCGDDGKEYATLTDYVGSGTTVTVADKVIFGGKEVPVTAVGSLAFYRKSVTEVILPDSVTEVGSFAFAYGEVKKVALGSSLTEIGEYCFVNCFGLERVEISGALPPTLNIQVFKVYDEDKNGYVVNPSVKIFVPSENLETYKKAKVWKDYASVLEGK